MTAFDNVNVFVVGLKVTVPDYTAEKPPAAVMFW